MESFLWLLIGVVVLSLADKVVYDRSWLLGEIYIDLLCMILQIRSFRAVV